MAADPFVSTLKLVAQDGYSIQYNCTVSDVANEYFVFESGKGDAQLPLNHGVLYLVDVICSEDGSDTTKATIYVNDKSYGDTLFYANNLATNVSRQFMGSPIPIAPGARIALKQLA